MIYWDTHVHSLFSGDSKSPVEQMMAGGKERGLSGMIFTDHLDWNYPNEPGLFDLDYYAYIDTLKKLANENTDIEIGAGVELGIQPHLKNRLREFLQKLSFDFVIGSVHVVNGSDPYYPEFFSNRSADDAYAEYFACVRDIVKDYKEYDSLGHLDYVVRYGLKNKGPIGGRMSFMRHREAIEEILSYVIKYGKSLEVNTGSFRYGMSEPNPSYDIMKLYYEMGGRAITIGSDAHDPTHVADHFSDVCDRLKSIGFTHYNVYFMRQEKEMAL